MPLLLCLTSLLEDSSGSLLYGPERRFQSVQAEGEKPSEPSSIIKYTALFLRPSDVTRWSSGAGESARPKQELSTVRNWAPLVCSVNRVNLYLVRRGSACSNLYIVVIFQTGDKMSERRQVDRLTGCSHCDVVGRTRTLQYHCMLISRLQRHVAPRLRHGDRIQSTKIHRT